MAITATLSSPFSATTIASIIPVYINIANSGASDVVILRIVSRIRETNNPYPYDATSKVKTSIGMPPNLVAPAGSSVNQTMQVIFHAPSLGSTYDISCDIYMTDGTIVSPTPITMTVTIPPGDIGA